MQIEFIRNKGGWDGNLFCVTHSDRPTELEQCSLNCLETRFGKIDRIPAKISFESLPHVETQQPYKGAVTVWEFEQDRCRKPRLLAVLRPKDYKPQHAVWHRKKLWILGVDRLEIYDSSISLLAVIRDPWLSGAHTIAPDGNGRLLLTCSASDSVLVLDEKSLLVESTLRMPETIYGRNFNLARSDSVVDHYILNDLQLTHINCAWYWRGGIVVSTLIQGAIGWFDSKGEYREIVRGFVGCHGIRSESRADRLYFSDSCLGAIVFLDDKFGISKRVDVGSKWLHDTVEMEGNLFAVSITDRNLIQFMDINSRQIVMEIPGFEFGMGTQFLSFGGS